MSSLMHCLGVMGRFEMRRCNVKKCDAETSRLSYLDKITWEFPKATDCVLPTAAEEQSFEEALSHLVRLFPRKRDKDTDTKRRKKLRNGLKAFSTKAKSCRKETLKEILNSLQFMERKRMYDPPADDEIRFFLLIKKYVRAMLTFFSVRGNADDDIRGQYDCFSYSKTLHNADELVELNRYLADFSAFVSELDITDGSAIKPLMGIRENDEVAPIIQGSKQRSNMFYWHKFHLALLDIRSSQYACFPAFPEEQRSYLRVLDLISSPSFSAKNRGEAMNIFSEKIYALFLERTEREIRDLERHCIRARTSLLDKLSIVDSWESLAERYNADPYGSDVEEGGELLAELKSRLVEKCRVSKEDLPNYIASVRRCWHIALDLLLLIAPRDIDCHDLYEATYSTWELVSISFGWDSLHAVTLFKRGSFSPGNVFREHLVLRNPKSNVKLQYEEAKMKKRKRVTEEEEEGEKENVKILDGIVQDLRRIGDSDARLDEEERVLMYKIWTSVASSVHFFTCAMAYEQRSHIMAHGGLPGVGKIVGMKMRKMTMKNSTNAMNAGDHCIKKKALNLVNIIGTLRYEMRVLVNILYVYEQGLSEKIGQGLHEKQREAALI